MVALLGLATWVTAALVVLFLFLSVLMVLVILIQRPQGGGLSGAFGSSAGSGQTAFGARTGDALTIATITVFILFLLMACGLNFAVRPPKGGLATPAATSSVPAETQAPAPAAETPSAPSNQVVTPPAPETPVAPVAEPPAQPPAEPPAQPESAPGQSK